MFKKLKGMKNSLKDTKAKSLKIFEYTKYLTDMQVDMRFFFIIQTWLLIKTFCK